ncbi:PilW family protein [Halomonas denitrificans]|uniref:PilW family protein n=1 Tax=Halomonas denitrificans TaxID=370769 RepID=UPI0013007F07|nr:prepilin-type N-terminal cleavage/methylation domain-containing protein [Halomonas denitrificans]
MELYHPFEASKRSRGFSLVELMIALVIGLMITLGAFQLFVTSQKTFNHSLAVLERQETLRFIVDSLSYDIRSSAATDMLDDSGVVLSDDAKITLNFDKKNSICDPVDEYTVQYYQPDGSEAIYVKSACGSDDINDVASGDSIVLGVASINFGYIDFGLGVRVTITMVDERGRLEDQVYRFTIANRSAVGRALELWGNGS